MNKFLVLILALVLVLCLASCDLIPFINVGNNGGVTTTTSTTTRPTTTRPTTTTVTTTTTLTSSNDNKDDPEPDEFEFYDFTSEEKGIIKEIAGIDKFPFIPNNEYYFETYSYDYDDATTEIGINFYTFGNTKAEFDVYKALFSDYVYAGSEVDEYGDTWYYYDAKDESHFVDMSYYEAEDGFVVDVYIYYYLEAEDPDIGTGDGTNHTYVAFSSSDKALMRENLGATIPFIPNDEYGLEKYSYEYEDGSYELGINFYTFDNTEAEFNAYLSQISEIYVFDYSEEDTYGDTWYYYTASEGFYFDISYYYYESSFVIDIYAYYYYEDGDSGSGSGGESGSTDTDVDLITNAGAGLPEGVDGVFEVDFTNAEYVKDVTDQGYYIDGCPTVGSPAVLVIPVEFKDVTAASKGYTTDALKNAFMQGGETDYYSVYDYYFISSYGDLALDITVLDEWFCPQYDSSYYYNATYDYYGDTVDIGDQLIMDEALAYLADTLDLSKYDSDSNGIIDAIVLINTLDISDENFYWAYRYWNIYTDEDGYYYEYDGVSANDYVWASYQFLYESYDEEGNALYDDASVMNTYTYIHEFAHVLGVDDYYDTTYIGSPLDGADIMDSMSGDHNAFTKFNLGWLTSSRLVTTDSSVTLTLEDFSKNGDTIILANNWDEKLGAYQEYYILVYYTANGLNAGENNGYFARDGIIVYHVNASLYKEEYDGTVYYDVYNNNTDASDSYGTEDNLIEFVKSGEDTFTYIVGSTFVGACDDNGNELGHTFTIDELTSENATITFTKK